MSFDTKTDSCESVFGDTRTQRYNCGMIEVLLGHYSRIFDRNRPPIFKVGGASGYDLEQSFWNREVLREKVAEQNYSVGALIHPLYHFWNRKQLTFLKRLKTAYLELAEVGEMSDILLPQQIFYSQELLRFLRNPQNKVMLLGEEEKKVDVTLAILRAQGYGGDLLYFRTFENRPRPASGDYRRVYAGISALGVKELVVSGMYGQYPPTIDTYLRFANKNEKGIEFRIDSVRDLPDLEGQCVEGFIEHIVGEAQLQHATTELQSVVLSPVVYSNRVPSVT